MSQRLQPHSGMRAGALIVRLSPGFSVSDGAGYGSVVCCSTTNGSIERRLDEVPTSVVAVETVERPQLVSLKSRLIGFLDAGLSIWPELSASLVTHGAADGGGVVVPPPPPPPPPLATAAAGSA